MNIINETKRNELLEVARVENKKVVLQLLEVLEMCTDEDDVHSIYTNIAGFLFYGQEYLEKVDTGLNFLSYMAVEVLKESKEDSLMFNKFIHELHLEFPGCREYAIDELGVLMECDKSYTLTNTNVYQGQVPDDIKKLIDNCLLSISDDLNYKVTTSWYFSHINCGIDYSYQQNESVEVELISLSQQAINLAVERLSQLNSTLAK